MPNDDSLCYTITKNGGVLGTAVIRPVCYSDYFDGCGTRVDFQVKLCRGKSKKTWKRCRVDNFIVKNRCPWDVLCIALFKMLPRNKKLIK